MLSYIYTRFIKVIETTSDNKLIIRGLRKVDPTKNNTKSVEIQATGMIILNYEEVTANWTIPVSNENIDLITNAIDEIEQYVNSRQRIHLDKTVEVYADIPELMKIGWIDTSPREFTGYVELFHEGHKMRFEFENTSTLRMFSMELFNALNNS